MKWLEENMKTDVFERIKKDFLHRLVYVIILAWDEVIREKQKAIASSENEHGQHEVADNEEKPITTPKDGDDQDRGANKGETAITSLEGGDGQDGAVNSGENRFFLPEGNMLPSNMWEDEQLSLQTMFNDAKAFLSDRLALDADGNVLPHVMLNQKRKKMYPVQADIVDYLKATRYAEHEYQQVSLQSSVSHALDHLRGIEGIKSKSFNRIELEGLIVRVHNEYKPFSARERRNEIIMDIAGDMTAIEKYGIKKFAKLAKDVIYDIGKGGIILFFDEDAKLDETQVFLKKFIGKQYLCDMFEIKGRLFVLLGGDEKDFPTTAEALDDLVKVIYQGQNKPRPITI